jgi:ribonuclease R
VSATVVATVQKRGRFWAAEPHFPPASLEQVPHADGASIGGRRAGGAGGRAARAGGRRRIVLASNRIAGAGGESARIGDLVLVQAAGRRGDHKARIVRLIGRPEVARDAIEALMLDRGLARTFADEVEREAQRARAQGGERAASEVAERRRRDLRGLSTFTIDPASAQDFDDALSAERLPGGSVRVRVHIADVSRYVPEGSLIDRVARERATSVYVPGAVEPMLPQALSNDACSLVPGRERAAVTVELDLRGAEVTRRAFYRSLICSDARLDYERVDRIFSGRERAEEPWAEPLQVAREASAALAEARARAGALALDSLEPEFAFDPQGNVSAIFAREQTESHRLIEHLMIAANEAVARHLADRAIPCLYRVHERPQPARVMRLAAQLASLGVPTPPVPDALSPSQAAELMGRLSQLLERHVIAALARGPRASKPGARGTRVGPWGGRIGLGGLVLRSLQQAYYSPRNIGHAGLRSQCYCHFTSPIRRYPDLVCHRALGSTFGGSEPAPQAGDLSDLGEWTSERERQAVAIERAADDIARCFALERALYEGGWERSFTGEVSGLISAGAFVSFAGELAPAPLYEGMLPARRMLADPAGDRIGGERAAARRSAPGRAAARRAAPRRRASGDWWELNELETVLHGERSGATVRLGDPIDVRVARVDTALGRVDLIPG